MMSLKKNIAFSIIMPAYNAEKTIKKSIESVLSQSFHDFELLIINDCSTDKTELIIQKYSENDSRVKLLNNEKNMGVAHTRNKGIEAAHYPIICFLDSDDLWSINKLREYYIAFKKGHNVLYSFYTRFTEKETLNLVTAPPTIDYKKLLKGNCIGNLTGAYDSSKIGKIFQKSVRHEDYLMWLEILQINGSATCIPQNLAYYRVSESSLSGNKFKSLLWTWRIYRHELNLNICHSAYLLLNSIFRAVLKRS